MAKRLKGKEWFTLVAPKLFDEKVIGETLSGDPDMLLGRRVEVSSMNLINDMSKYYIKIYFKIHKIKEDRAYVQFDSFECLRDYISRFIRHRIDRIDTIQDLKTKDNKKIRVKAISIANRRVKRSIEKEIRTFVRDAIKKEVEKNDLDGFLEIILNDSLKNYVLNEGSKIYPLRAFEIRKMEVLSH